MFWTSIYRQQELGMAWVDQDVPVAVQSIVAGKVLTDQPTRKNSGFEKERFKVEERLNI